MLWGAFLFDLVLIAGLAGLAYAFGLDVWVAISGGVGGFIGFLLLQTPPMQRWLHHVREGRSGSDQPRSDAP
ncbi:hypothetical protein SAMN05660662_0143 [Blastococcus aurantiacus]|uniref:Uncharacterized protein n=1 Tax=Blastococcus aurantiacus TaxID=1550231 RepID=A0A1G7R2C4_9ACTN|nr:hypothetical protein SAMN05660662_0143 [Blastococcus aurantiacus]